MNLPGVAQGKVFEFQVVQVSRGLHLQSSSGPQAIEEGAKKGSLSQASWPGLLHEGGSTSQASEWSCDR